MAGLEALKDAGIVSGEGDAGWMLPGHMRDTTGVMYASSFPALDAAIGEVRESDSEGERRGGEGRRGGGGQGARRLVVRCGAILGGCCRGAGVLLPGVGPEGTSW